jgi:hypothetical protein
MVRAVPVTLMRPGVFSIRTPAVSSFRAVVFIAPMPALEAVKVEVVDRILIHVVI